MTKAYDKYYETEILFGTPYPELRAFFTQYPQKGKVLDLGCGQGRDAIPLARMGFELTAIDNSKVGIDQINKIVKLENLNVKGEVADIFEFNNFSSFDFVLLDSMFHFAKKDQVKEIDFEQKVIAHVGKGCLVVFCKQATGQKVKILKETIGKFKLIEDQKFIYTFKDEETGHQSATKYRMVVLEK